MIRLTLKRFSGGDDSTLSLLYLDGAFACYGLEDQYQTTKVYAETRIPAGTYAIELREAGSLHTKYAQRFSDVHRGMLWLQDVPEFEYIYVHCGNDDDETAGCILVGDGQTQNVSERGSLLRSSAAYRRVYPLVAERMLAGEVCEIEVVDP